MPQRILRQAIRQSKRWNRCTYFEQSLFIRLLTLVDDFARYEADGELIRSEAFPYGDPDGKVVPVTAIDSALLSIASKDMLLIYEFEGKKFMQLTRWKERVRADVSRFPDPKECALLSNAVICQQMTASPPTEPPTPTKAPTVVVAPLPVATVKDVFDAWNMLGVVPKCLIVSDQRRRKIELRLRDPFFRDNWRPATDRIKRSHFCQGGNDRGWKANFDWFIQPDSVAKLMEGKYENNGGTRTNGANKNHGTLNAGRSSQYANVGKMAGPSNSERPGT